MTITTKYDIGQSVEHTAEETGRTGLIVGFRLTGFNHLYQVQWSATSSCWHYDFELRPSINRQPIHIPIKTAP